MWVSLGNVESFGKMVKAKTYPVTNDINIRKIKSKQFDFWILLLRFSLDKNAHIW